MYVQNEIDSGKLYQWCTWPQEEYHTDTTIGTGLSNQVEEEDNINDDVPIAVIAETLNNDFDVMNINDYFDGSVGTLNYGAEDEGNVESGNEGNEEDDGEMNNEANIVTGRRSRYIHFDYEPRSDGRYNTRIVTNEDTNSDGRGVTNDHA